MLLLKKLKMLNGAQDLIANMLFISPKKRKVKNINRETYNANVDIISVPLVIKK